MPKTKSAKKALRQSLRRRSKNLAHKRQLQMVIKRYRELVSASSLAEAKEYLATVYKVLDKAARARLITTNKSSRLKARLTHKLKSP